MAANPGSDAARITSDTNQMGADHNTTQPSQHEMNVALLSSHKKDKNPTPSAAHMSGMHDWLRHLRLQALGLPMGCCSRRKPSKEHRKVAMHHNRWMAALHSLLHTIPLAGAITLLSLRLTKYWVGHTPPDSTALQFVAKLHELLMQVSIVEVILCIIRTEAVRGFVPLGALSGAMAATRLSYLWSLDFFAIFATNSFNRWRKLFFGIAIPFLLWLTALVGPSSAVLMIPRPGSPIIPREGKLWTNVSIDDIYPVQVNQTIGFSLIDLAEQGLEMSPHERGKYKDTTPVSYSVREIGSGVPRLLRSIRLHGYGNGGLYLTTIPIRFPSEGFTYLAPLRNETLTVTAGHPVVESNCHIQNSASWTKSHSVSYIQDDGSSLAEFTDVSTLAKMMGNATAPWEPTFPDLLNSGWKQEFPPSWFQSPEPGSKSIVVALPFWNYNISGMRAPSFEWILTESDHYTRQSLTIQTCTLSAYWITSEIQISPNQDRIIMETTSPLSRLVSHDATPIAMNVTGFEKMADKWPLNHRMDTIPAQVAQIVALMITNAAREAVFHEGRYLRWGTPSNGTTFEFKVTDYGYGYATTSTSITLSVVVITGYCIVTVLYIAYILITGSTSTAWNSAIELTMLALQSRKPEHLGHTSVGINSLETLKQSVGIRVNEEDKLELVFADDWGLDKSGLRKIERNKAY